MDLGSRVIGFLGKKDNVVHLFLAGAFVALGVRSSGQQDEINALEVEKDSLRRGNKAMQKAMWEWRHALFHLAESDPSSFPISLSKLRAIYGEEDAAGVATSPAGATAAVSPPPALQSRDTTGETTPQNPTTPPRFTV